MPGTCNWGLNEATIILEDLVCYAVMMMLLKVADVYQNFIKGMVVNAKI